MPAGALHVVTGPGETVGHALVTNPDVDGITFTGSYDVGMEIYRTFTREHPKPTICEMGGKNPVIVSRHADLDVAAQGTARSAFGLSGQKCSAASRAYVERPVAAEFIRRLVDQAAGHERRRPARARHVHGTGRRRGRGRAVRASGRRSAPLGHHPLRRRALARRGARSRLLPAADRRRGATRLLDLDHGAVRAAHRGRARGLARRGVHPGQRHAARSDRGDVQHRTDRGRRVPAPDRGRASSTSTARPARPRAHGPECSRSAAGRVRGRTARRAEARTTCSNTFASRAERWWVHDQAGECGPGACDCAGAGHRAPGAGGEELDRARPARHQPVDGPGLPTRARPCVRAGDPGRRRQPLPRLQRGDRGDIDRALPPRGRRRDLDPGRRAHPLLLERLLPTGLRGALRAARGPSADRR